ncbi:LysR family transcriptional regulator [Natronospirillum operosum]|uniref:LysR family transcriptional regulator n=1 Tax=Natronospirillum operosum TaxID=2759953 RepID=A0A4Z0W6S0_9GAMM|nr:LysR substrate-binding domain-containing protein [Natronospirillum operosum]TGG92039.1 LysR family transcriptional regulator [Natronospirillum operosum]
MAHNPITVELIRTLDAIDRHGSFAAAAEHLHKVPSALTYTLQKCERDLEIKLFDRSGHRAEWTEAARHILSEGRRILVAMENLGHSAQRLAQGWTTQYVVALDHLLDFEQIVPLLTRAHEDIPWVPVHVRQGTLSGTWELLLEHEADLVVAPLHSKPDAGNIETRPIGTIRMVLAVARDHPLAAVDRPLTEDDLLPYPVVTNQDTARQITPLTAGLRQRRQQLLVPDMSTKILAQKRGLGIGFLPMHRIQQEVLGGDLILKSLASNDQEREMTLVAGWRQGDSDKTHHWMLEHLELLSIN